MKSQQQNLLGNRDNIRRSKQLWPCLLSVVACILGCINIGHYMPVRPVHAAANNRNNPSAVRPIPATTKDQSGRRSVSSPSPRTRLPFLPSRNSRRAAKEAYLLHLQKELKLAQRQLYASQNTCTTLRRRWEDQRMETLELMACRSRDSIEDFDEAGEVEGDGEATKIQQQDEEIERLQSLLQMETEKYKDQIERLNLLSLELKELHVWKEEQEQQERGELMQYDQQLQESHQKQNDYAEQVELLTLKLEAAENAARQSIQQGDGRDVKDDSKWEQRAQALKAELESLKADYSALLNNSRQAEQEGEQRQQQVEEEMDRAIQSAVESAVEKVEREWETRYQTLEGQLSNTTEWATSLEAERDAALSRVEAALSSSMVQSTKQGEDSELLKKQQTLQLREDLTAELTDTLTDKLTERLTIQLTDALSEKIEKRYKKKHKRLCNELKEQQHKTSEEGKQLLEDMTRQREQLLKAERIKVKEEYELEYQSKLQELQNQSEEQVRLQKERMRKLVRALLEREAKQKKRGGTADKKKQPGLTKKQKTSTSSKRKKVGGDVVDEEDNSESERISTSSLSSSRKMNRSRPGVVPLRRNR